MMKRSPSIVSYNQQKCARWRAAGFKQLHSVRISYLLIQFVSKDRSASQALRNRWPQILKLYLLLRINSKLTAHLVSSVPYLNALIINILSSKIFDQRRNGVAAMKHFFFFEFGRPLVHCNEWRVHVSVNDTNQERGIERHWRLIYRHSIVDRKKSHLQKSRLRGKSRLSPKATVHIAFSIQILYSDHNSRSLSLPNLLIKHDLNWHTNSSRRGTVHVTGHVYDISYDTWKIRVRWTCYTVQRILEHFEKVRNRRAGIRVLL